MRKNNNPYHDDSIKIAHQKVVAAIEGIHSILEMDGITDASREALFPMLHDGIVFAGIFASDGSTLHVPEEIIKKSSIWLSHAEELIEQIK